jgi:hypothetical protein
MSELLCIARLKIHHGKLDEFKHLAARCVELVRTKDTGTLQKVSEQLLPGHQLRRLRQNDRRPEIRIYFLTSNIFSS